jgi:hypothetical protein
MKILVLLLILIGLLTPSADAQKKDTTFLLREWQDGTYRVIYVAGKNTGLHQRIPEFLSIDTAVYQRMITQLKDSGVVARKFDMPVANEWYSLHWYKGKAYTYLPSEPYTNLSLKWSDSALVLNYFDEGHVPALIQQVEWKGPAKLSITTKSLYPTEEQVVLHFLSPKKDVMVLEFPLRPLDRRYHYMVARKSLQRYPLIVNSCPDRRCREWEFEQPPYSKLLRRR